MSGWEEPGDRLKHWLVVIVMGAMFTPLAVHGGMGVVMRRIMTLRGRGRTMDIELFGQDAVFYGLMILIPGLLGMGGAAWYAWTHLARRER